MGIAGSPVSTVSPHPLLMKMPEIPTFVSGRLSTRRMCLATSCAVCAMSVSKQHTFEAAIDLGDMSAAVSKLCQTCAVDYHRASVACGPGSNDGWHRAIGAIDASGSA